MTFTAKLILEWRPGDSYDFPEGLRKNWTT